MTESFASVETHVERDTSIVESECESGIDSGAGSSSTSGLKSAVSSGLGRSEEEKVVFEKKVDEKKKPPPPVPARVTACVSMIIQSHLWNSPASYVTESNKAN